MSTLQPLLLYTGQLAFNKERDELDVNREK